MPALFKELSGQRCLLWVTYGPDKVVRAAFVTRVTQYPSKTMLSVDFAGGSMMRAWVDDVQRTFREYARDAGLGGVEMAGRGGWTRMLGRYGWKPSMVVLEVSAADGEPS
ncbi:MAG: hypothetical protein WC829_10745 [Hyphomicrobium sp.]|jgi:hypothetical protein